MNALSRTISFRITLSLVTFASLALWSAVALADSPREIALETAKRAIRAAMMEDEDAAFDAYLETIHPERKEMAQARNDIRRYSWKRFRQQYDHFITDRDVNTLRIQRMNPEEITPDVQTFRLFFEAINKEGRLPAPIIFRRHGETWLIDTNSL